MFELPTDITACNAVVGIDPQRRFASIRGGQIAGPTAETVVVDRATSITHAGDAITVAHVSARATVVVVVGNVDLTSIRSVRITVHPTCIAHCNLAVFGHASRCGVR